MVFAFKTILVLLMVVGIAIALYGAWEISGTRISLNASSGKANGEFVGYYRDSHETTSISSLPGGSPGTEHTLSVATYPEFTYRAEDGSIRKVREPKVHVVEIYKPGEEVDILLFAHVSPRLAGFYSLYVRDLAILVIGLGFFLLPFCLWKFALPALESRTRSAVFTPAREVFGRMFDLKVGPVRFRFILIGFAGLMGFALVMALIAGLTPYLAQMRFGAGGRLIQALEEKRFDEAGEMIARGTSIHSTNEYGQSPLLLALEAGRMDLARALIQAGADVNVKSKMYKTPLRVATQSGDLDMVKLLLARGASPDAPEDESPPFAYALAKGDVEIARALVEGGTNLHKRYQFGDRMCTVGDMAVFARKHELAELIRRRGGSFSHSKKRKHDMLPKRSF
jgi:hypothetical protein